MEVEAIRHFRLLLKTGIYLDMKETFIALSFRRHLVSIFVLDKLGYTCCDDPNPGVPLTTRQPAEFMWISSDPIPHCCAPFIGIHLFTKIGAESPLFGELYRTYNLYNSIIIPHPGFQQK